MEPNLIAFRQCPNSWRKMTLLHLPTLAPPAFLLAQNRPVKFERIGLEQGFSQSTVNNSFMWFDKDDKLNKIVTA